MTNRVSVKPFLMDYVRNYGEGLGISDPSEIVSLIIIDHMRGLTKPEQAVGQRSPQSSEGNLLSELSELL